MNLLTKVVLVLAGFAGLMAGWGALLMVVFKEADKDLNNLPPELKIQLAPATREETKHLRNE